MHVDAWQQAYRGLVPDAHLDGLDHASSSARWAAKLASPGDCAVMVAEGSAGVCGFMVHETIDGDLWVHALYVHPTEWGRGVGTALLDTLPPEPASLWVLAGNTRARAFYSRHGFVYDGGEHEHPKGGVIVRYRRRRAE